MNTYVPSYEELRRAMRDMRAPELERLSAASGVPFHTLRKLRDAETVNPRLETVRKVWPYLKAAA